MKQLATIATCVALAATSWRGLAAASPLSPDQERATFQLADTNLAIELVAAEPDVRAPVAIAWDADGRMFVAEMTDYPSGPVSGRIRLLEDCDGDGRCERATIFATNLAFPNGVMAWKNGVLVTAAPDIWFLADTNADGVADVREKILTGFAEGNQQLRVNGLYWGIDNWIYGCNGRSDGEVKWADGPRAGSIRRHDFRFRPETKEFEVIAGNSQFGMGHDDWGNRFPVFNAIPIRHVVIEDRSFARQPLLAGTDNTPSISPANEGNRIFAVTSPNVLIPQPVGFFTSACGPSIFRGTALPESYRGNYFVCEPVQNVVQRRVLKPNGSTFVAEYAHTNKEFLASSDPWFHGVFTATGPDGAFYIVDFYRDLVEHPAWVAPELRDKVDWRKGEEHGRIWRVRTKGSRVPPMAKLSRASNEELVRALDSANGWTRDTAHRLLIERNAVDAIQLLNQVFNSGVSSASRVAALAILSGLNALDVRQVHRAMIDSDPPVREHAIRLAERFLTDEGTQRPDAHLSAAVVQNGLAVRQFLTNNVAGRGDDSDARVRLQVACALGNVSDQRVVLSGLTRVARHVELDSWQTLAVLGSAGPRPWSLGKELTPLLDAGTEPQLHLLERLAMLVASGTNTEDASAMLNWLRDSRSPNRLLLLAAFIEATPQKTRAKTASMTPGNELAATASDGTMTERVRVAAIRLAAVRQDTLTLAALGKLLNREQSDTIQIAVARALLDANDVEMARVAFAHWPECSKIARRQIVVASVRQANAARTLLDAVERGGIPLVEVDPATRQALQKSSDVAVKERAAKLFANTSADREAVVQKFRVALKLEGNRARGADAFERTCMACHQMQGVGARVGPDLSGIGQHARETLLVEILDPSRAVLPDFVAYNATTKSGDIYTGFIANESATTVTLRRANEPDVTLKRTDLREFKTSGQSLMPDGLEVGMSEQDMADLIEFLRRPDRTLFNENSKSQNQNPK
ncbi:MAG TPA: PVC-type heme-binding CxxCH protein [Verrucomicrobiae bacterium]